MVNCQTLLPYFFEKRPLKMNVLNELPHGFSLWIRFLLGITGFSQNLN